MRHILINMKSLLLSILAILGLYFSSFSQKKSNKEDLNSAGNLQAQYDYLWNSSGKYQANKVIKMSVLNQFNSNVQDSLEAVYDLHMASNNNSASKSLAIKELELEKAKIDSLYQESQKKVDAFEFSGIETTKSSFRALFLIISSVLLALSLVAFFRMRSKANQAAEDKSRYETLELEFEDYKKRSREKEQVLARQLQDEINKNL